jgi:hypothetical protein
MSYTALFLTPDLMLIGSKGFKATDKFLNYKKGTFKVRLDAYLYKTQNGFFYGYIYPTDELMLIDTEMEPIRKGDKELKLTSARLITIKEKVENGDLFLIVGESIIGQLARAFLNTIKTNWLFVILAIGAGIAIGYIAGTALGSHAVTTIYNSTVTAKPIPTV